MPDLDPPELGNEDPVFLSLLDEAHRGTVTDPGEWFGEPHTLIVRAVRLPDGPFDDGELTDYDIEHPPTCKQEERGPEGHTSMAWTCDVAGYEGDIGLPFTLRYSGTPVTRPGTYRIQSWGRKTWYHDWGAEDSGERRKPPGGPYRVRVWVITGRGLAELEAEQARTGGAS